MNAALERKIWALEVRSARRDDWFAVVERGLRALDLSVPESPDSPPADPDDLELFDRLRQHEFHQGQSDFYRSGKKRIAAACTRSGGKSEVGIRKLIRHCAQPENANQIWIACEPTFQMARRVLWPRLKRYTKPFRFGPTRETVRESDLELYLWNGTMIVATGLDKPDRVEGFERLDGAWLDEFGSIKDGAFENHVSGGLSRKGVNGAAWFTGTHEPNHWKRLFRSAQASDYFDTFEWDGASLLDPEELAKQRDILDEAQFLREFCCSWEGYGNRAYYAFRADEHVEIVAYDPDRPLLIGFDFNVAPGIAVIAQQVRYQGMRKNRSPEVLAILGEVWIKDNSNTPKVCEAIESEWKHHRGEVQVFGDASGGARKTSATEGSDWTLVKKHLGPVFDGRIRYRVPRANPAERARVNTVNSLLKSASGSVGLIIDPICEKTIEDFEATPCKEDGSIDKKDTRYSHITDGAGYLCHTLYPPRSGGVSISNLL